jgi:hypothetical protein
LNDEARLEIGAVLNAALGRAYVPDEIAEALAQARPRLGPLGLHLLWFDDIGSTNDRALAWAEAGAERGLRRAGRRPVGGPRASGPFLGVARGRRHLRERRLAPSAQAMGLLTMAAGLGVADGVAAATGLQTHVKWPNDVCVAGRPPRKLAGILAEAGVSAIARSTSSSASASTSSQPPTRRTSRLGPRRSKASSGVPCLAAAFSPNASRACGSATKC